MVIPSCCSPIQVPVALRLVLACSTVAFGCTSGPDGEQQGDAGGRSAAAVKQSVVRGHDVTAEVRVTPQSLRLSDEAEVRITVTADPDLELQMPPRDDAAFPDFQVRDFDEPLAAVRDQLQVLEQVYRVEPLRTGSLEIGPFDVRIQQSTASADSQDRDAQDRDDQDRDDQEQWLTTDLLQVEVTSMLESEAPSLADLAPAETPVEVPSPLPAWIPWSLGAVCLLLIAGLLWRRWSRKTEVVREPSPREVALDALERLLHSQSRTADLQQFYEDLSDIVRTYIESAMGIQAPEQTTEEFLRDPRTQSVFTETDRSQLRAFLQTADLVKFARHRPGDDEIDWSIERAREFLTHDAGPDRLDAEMQPESAARGLDPDRYEEREHARQAAVTTPEPGSAQWSAQWRDAERESDAGTPGSTSPDGVRES